MLELIAPTASLHPAWLEAHAEWGPGSHEDGFGLHPSDELESGPGFAAWLSRLAAQSEPVRPGDTDSRCTYRWIVEGGRVIGGIALRHGDGDEVWSTGHIGYGIRPSARGRGFATWALRRILEEARSQGMGQIWVVCALDNVASMKTIERCGGVFAEIKESKMGPVRRYRIDLPCSVRSVRGPRV